DGAESRTDLVVIATGVRPAAGLLVRAGARHLPDGSVAVDASMRTSLPDVFAAGDCVPLPHLVLGRPAWVPLGPAANKGGRVAGREGAAKRIDVLATALHAGFSVADLATLDLSYAPPFAPVYDPLLAAAIKAASGAGQPVASTLGGSP